MKGSGYTLIGFVILAIVGLVYITRQQRERFEVDMEMAKQLVKPNIRLSNIQRQTENLQDSVNAAVGKHAMNGIQ
jgi:hypothetical protein